MTAFTYQLVITVTRPMLPLYAAKLGASEFNIGLLVATYAFFPMVFAIQIGKMTDRIGNYYPSVCGTVGLVVGVSLPAFFPTMWALFVSQTIVGLSQILINVSLQNIIGTSSTATNQDRNFSFFSLAVSMGWLIGPVVGGYLGDYFRFQTVYLYTILFGLCAFGFALFLPRVRMAAYEDGTVVETEQPAHAKGTFGLLWKRDVRVAMVTSALVLYSRDIFVAYFPIYASSQGYTASIIGWIISIMGMALVMIRLSLPRMILLWGRMRVLFGSLVMGGVSFLLIPVHGYLYVVIGLAILLGMGLGCGQPLSMSITYNAAPESRTAEVLGLRLAVNRCSQVVAPLLFGAIGTVVGVSFVFYFSGAFLLSGAMYALRK